MSHSRERLSVWWETIPEECRPQILSQLITKLHHIEFVMCGKTLTTQLVKLTSLIKGSFKNDLTCGFSPFRLHPNALNSLYPTGLKSITENDDISLRMFDHTDWTLTRKVMTRHIHARMQCIRNSPSDSSLYTFKFACHDQTCEDQLVWGSHAL